MRLALVNLATIEFEPQMREARHAADVAFKPSPSLSVECSPPRGCYAKTQRIYYVFNCAPRYAMPVERLSTDINGSIIKQETRTGAEPYSADADVGAFVILETYCPVRGWRDRR